MELYAFLAGGSFVIVTQWMARQALDVYYSRQGPPTLTAVDVAGRAYSSEEWNALPRCTECGTVKEPSSGGGQIEPPVR